MIFYFSGTGNSQYVAERIAQAASDKLFVITDCVKNQDYTVTLAEGEALGIVSPTYFGGLPVIVSDFLSKIRINFESEPYIYFVATCGTLTGGINILVNQYLKKLNCQLSAGFSVKMPDNWTPMYSVRNTEKIQKINQKAELKITKVTELIQKRVKGRFMRLRAPLLLVKPFYRAYEKARETRRFHVEESCTGCGLCVKKCPVSAIVLEVNKPKWVKDRCVMCLGCLHRCPEFAIQYGRRTKNHGQYLHPKVRL